MKLKIDKKMEGEKNIIVLFVCLLFFINSCKSYKTQIKEKQKCKDNLTQKINVIIDNDTLHHFDNESYLNLYIDTLNKALSINNISNFLYDECLDNRSQSYSYIHSHKKKSLRYNLIQKLNREQIEKILTLSDKNRLNKTCITFEDLMPFSNKTTLELLEERIR